MSIRVGLAITIYLIFAAPLASASNCLGLGQPRGETESKVMLIRHIATPYFYFRSMDYNYTVLMRPKPLLKTLQSSTRNDNAEAHELNAAIRHGLPLRQSTDLFKYVLSNYYSFSAIQRAVTQMLQRGEAAVFDARTGEFLRAIRVKHNNSKRMRSTTFYDPEGNVLMQQLGCVEN